MFRSRCVEDFHSRREKKLWLLDRGSNLRRPARHTSGTDWATTSLTVRGHVNEPDQVNVTGLHLRLQLNQYAERIKRSQGRFLFKKPFEEINGIAGFADRYKNHLQYIDFLYS